MSHAGLRNGSKRFGGRFRILFGLALFLGALVWFAPWLVARSPFKQSIVSLLGGNFDGDLSIGSASLGWLSPVVLRDVVAHTPDGQTLLEVDEIAGDRKLLKLLFDTTNVGNFRVSGLQLNVELDDSSSNVERFMLRPSERDTAGGQAPPPRRQWTADIIDGSVQITEVRSAKTWSLSDVNALAKAGTHDSPQFSLTASSSLSAAGNTNQLRIEFGADTGPSAPSAGGVLFPKEGRLRVECERLPLDLLGALLRRNLSDVQLAGSLNAHLDCSWTAEQNQPAASVRGNVSIRNLTLVAPGFSATDVLSLDHLDWDGQLQMSRGRLTAQSMALRCDVGWLEANGTIPITSWADFAPLELLREEDYQLQAQLELARLVRLLPGTLRIRKEAQITGGQVHLAMFSSLEGGQRQWKTDLKTTSLSTIANGRATTWQQPMQIKLRAHQSETGVHIDHLSCNSDSFYVTGSGTLNENTVSARCDLTSLFDHLAPLFDLDDVQLGGSASAELATTRNATGEINARGEFTLNDLRVALPGRRPWVERKLTATLVATGHADARGMRRLNHATFLMESENDQVAAQLIRPVIFAEPGQHGSGEPVWPLKITLTGQVQTWLARVGPLVPLDDWTCTGLVRLDTEGTLSGSAAVIASLNAELTELEAHRKPWFIQEPVVRIAMSGAWSRPRGLWESKSMTLETSAISLRADDVVLVAHESGPPSASGKIAFRGDLARLWRWTHPTDTLVVRRPAGEVTGQITLLRDGSLTHAEYGATIKSLEIQRPGGGAPTLSGSVAFSGPHAGWETVWSEPQVTLRGRTSYDHYPGLLEFSRLELNSQLVKLTAAGSVKTAMRAQQGTPVWQNNANVDVTGDIEYNLQSILDLLQTYLGDRVRITGSQRDQFWVRGSLKGASTDSASGTSRQIQTGHPSSWPKDLVARAGFGWTSAEIYGLTVGKGRLQAQLADSRIDFAPLDLAVSRGRVYCRPTILLDPTPARVTVAPGVLANDIQISPQMCATWLKYVAPTMADATRIDGRLSIDISGANIPLTELKTSDVTGTLRIHSAQLRPGPAAEPYVNIASQVRALIRRRPITGASVAGSWVTLQPQNIPFRMVDGRVHHHNMNLSIGDVSIRTSGSVGVDQTLDLVAYIPIQDDWVANDPILASLRGQVLQIPIRGSLSKPDVDEKALARIARQIAGSAVQERLEDELIRGLNRLFPN